MAISILKRTTTPDLFAAATDPQKKKTKTEKGTTFGIQAGSKDSELFTKVLRDMEEAKRAKTVSNESKGKLLTLVSDEYDRVTLEGRALPPNPCYVAHPDGRKLTLIVQDKTHSENITDDVYEGIVEACGEKAKDHVEVITRFSFNPDVMNDIVPGTESNPVLVSDVVARLVSEAVAKSPLSADQKAMLINRDTKRVVVTDGLRALVSLASANGKVSNLFAALTNSRFCRYFK